MKRIGYRAVKGCVKVSEVVLNWVCTRATGYSYYLSYEKKKYLRLAKILRKNKLQQGLLQEACCKEEKKIIRLRIDKI